MANKTNAGLVAYAISQLGNPYWYGTYGQTASVSLYNAKKKQYPKYYTADDYSTQNGKRVHDCVGLVKGYLWSETETSAPKYNSAQDKSANGMRNLCVEKGGIKTMPEIPGVLVFMSGHVGVYIGNGYVVEAMGHKQGVVKTKLSERKWIHWGKCPYITYEETSSVDKPAVSVLEWQKAAIADGFKFPKYGADGKWGAECESVAKQAICKKRLTYKYKNLTKIVQEAVGVKVDGKFGNDTKNAVIKWQKLVGITADGAVGINTWKKILGV